MRLTTFTDYSLRMLVYVAVRPDGRATIGEVAAAYGISEHHLTKVAQFLGKSGYLENLRGRGGGLRLAKAPESINVGELVKLAEGGDIPAACFDPQAAGCAIQADCLLRGMLAEAVESFYRALRRHTLADIVANRQALARVLLVAGPGLPPMQG